MITVPPGKVNAQFFLQALGKSGTATYTAVANGFASRVAKIGLAPRESSSRPGPTDRPMKPELFRKGQEGSRGFVVHLKPKMQMAVWTAQLDPLTLRSADITVQLSAPACRSR